MRALSTFALLTRTTVVTWPSAVENVSPSMSVKLIRYAWPIVGSARIEIVAGKNALKTKRICARLGFTIKTLKRECALTTVALVFSQPD